MRAPGYLIFYVTGKCNANCRHCFNWEREPNDLSLDEIENIARKWGRLHIVNLTGGEPYLRNDLIPIIRAFNTKIIAIPSNGIDTKHIVLLIEILLLIFPNKFFRFTFSIDGIGEAHDKIRGVECFDKVCETIKQVAKLKARYKNFCLLTNSCFMHDNQNTLLDTLKYIVKNFDVDAPSVTYVRGNPMQPSSKQSLDINKYAEIVDYLNRLDYRGFRHHPMSWYIRNVTLRARKKVLDNLKTGRQNFKCYAPDRMVVVDNVGNVKLCEMLPTVIGNLKDYDYDIKKVLKNKYAKPYCINCHWECAIRTGLIYNPKEWMRNITYGFTRR